MGETRRWGDSFARWYLALPKGRKYVVSLGLALVTLLTPGLITSQLAPLLWSENQQVQVWCSQDGSWTVWVSSDDPRLDPENLELSLHRICDVDITSF